MTRSARATQGEIARALRAAKEAGPNFAVEVLPNGTIRIVPVDRPNADLREPELAEGRDAVLW